jgi:hypothetical protein
VKALWLLIPFAAVTAACSHHPLDDYPAYVSTHQNRLVLPPLNQQVTFSVSPRVDGSHKTTHASLMHTYYVEFGKVLRATMASPDVQRAFTAVEGAPAGNGLHIAFDLRTYDFDRARAIVDMTVSSSVGDRVILTKEYQAEGESASGKIIALGDLAVPSAIRESTKEAMDKIIPQLVADLQAALRGAHATLGVEKRVAQR